MDTAGDIVCCGTEAVVVVVVVVVAAVAIGCGWDTADAPAA